MQTYLGKSGMKNKWKRLTNNSQAASNISYLRWTEKFHFTPMTQPNHNWDKTTVKVQNDSCYPFPLNQNLTETLIHLNFTVKEEWKKKSFRQKQFEDIRAKELWSFSGVTLFDGNNAVVNPCLCCAGDTKSSRVAARYYLLCAPSPFSESFQMSISVTAQPIPPLDSFHRPCSLSHLVISSSEPSLRPWWLYQTLPL